MKKNRVSIPSGRIAEGIVKGESVKWGGFCDFDLHICERNGEPSGGAVVHLRVNRLDHSITGATHRQARIRKGWNEATISRAVYRLVSWLNLNLALWLQRRNLYNFVELHDIPDDVQLPKGYDSCYSTMKGTDIYFWYKHIPEKFPTHRESIRQAHSKEGK